MHYSKWALWFPCLFLVHLSLLWFDEWITSLVAAERLASFPAGRQDVFCMNPPSLLTRAGPVLPVQGLLTLLSPDGLLERGSGLEPRMSVV